MNLLLGLGSSFTRKGAWNCKPVTSKASSRRLQDGVIRVTRQGCKRLRFEKAFLLRCSQLLRSIA